MTLSPTDHHETDLAVLDAAKRDPAAFEPIYRAYAPAIFRFCYRKLGDRETAADVTSLVFIKAITALSSFAPDPRNPGTTFRAWLYRIAGNAVIDHRRAHRTHIPLASDDDSPDLAELLPAPGDSPEEIAITQSERREVRAALDTLPDRQRTIIELRLAGLTSPEIAEATGWTLSAVKSAQNRAYATLRTALAPVVNRQGSTT